MTSTAGRGGDTTTCATVAPRETELETQTPVHIVVRPERRVAWDPSVVDNEHLGRKSSKCLSLSLDQTPSHLLLPHALLTLFFVKTVCCIFHKRHVFGEDSGSSSSSSSDSSSSSSSSSCSSSEDEGECADGTHHHCCEDGRKHRKHKRRMNAYERQPRYVQALQEQLKREKELQQQQQQRQ